jgi:4-amino-4-deoxy-L-arabinose transferase-like glycosyltransferase
MDRHAITNSASPRTSEDATNGDAAPRWHWLISILLPVGILLPFINKPVHIDDTAYIAIAKQIVQHPLDYYGFSLNWEGVAKPVYEWHRNPPLANYYLAGIGVLFGWREWVLHLGFLLPAMLTGLGTYWLAAPLCKRPLIAVICTICNPAFVVTASGLMLDTWLLAFFVLATASLLQGYSSNRLRWIMLAGICAGLAAWTKYFGAALIPLFLLYALLARNRPKHWWVSLAIPIVMIAVEQFHFRSLYGHTLFSSAANSVLDERSPRPWWLWPLLGLSFCGGCTFSVMQVGAVLWSVKQKLIGVALALLAALALYLLNARGIRVQTLGFDLPAVSLVVYALFILGGTQVFTLAYTELRNSTAPASWLLALWVVGTFVFASFITWSVNARSVLPLIPALAILALRRLDYIAIPNPVRSRRRIAIGLVASALISLAVARADMEWAQSAKTAAATYAQRAKSHPGAVYFQGHWGFQHYMSEAGIPPLDFESTVLNPGDIVICPENNANVRPLPRDFVATRHEDTFAIDHRMATMSIHLGAGFYSDLWGPLPFALGLKMPPDKYYVYAVGKAGKPFATQSP